MHHRKCISANAHTGTHTRECARTQFSRARAQFSHASHAHTHDVNITLRPNQWGGPDVAKGVHGNLRGEVTSSLSSVRNLDRQLDDDNANQAEEKKETDKPRKGGLTRQQSKQVLRSKSGELPYKDTPIESTIDK